VLAYLLAGTVVGPSRMGIITIDETEFYKILFRLFKKNFIGERKKLKKRKNNLKLVRK
jgi:hypothetical protein